MDTSDSAVMVSVPSRKALPTTKRVHRSLELKRQMVEESLAPGASVAGVAQAHGVNANLLFNWRRQYRQGLLGVGTGRTPGLLAVRVAEAPCAPDLGAGGRAEVRRTGTETPRTPSGTIQIELPKGRVRLSGSVDPETLRVVLEALGG
jgi:transposase